MKISKYLHSCLVFEKDGFKLLFDPGRFSFAEGRVTAEMFADVDAIIITHNHPDHLDKENLKKILNLSAAKLYSNAEVLEEIQEVGELVAEGALQIGPFGLDVLNVQHEAILDSPIPEMQAYFIDGKVLHPVDSFAENLFRFGVVELLILPTMAPFTTELDIAAFAQKIRPKKILPVHDGYARDFFLEQRYENYQKYFEKSGIHFLHAGDPGITFNI